MLFPRAADYFPVPDPVPKHQGHTGTGCYKLHDHEFVRPRGRPPRKGGGGGVSGVGGGHLSPPANLMDLPVMEAAGSGGGGVHMNATKAALKHLTSPPDRTPVSCTIGLKSTVG